jgi:carbon storage regulator
MLVLSRKSRESIRVGGPGTLEPSLKVTVLEIKNDRVRLGFEADGGILIHRREVWERIRAGVRPESLGGDPAPQAVG